MRGKLRRMVGLYTTGEVAIGVGVSSNAIADACDRGVLPCIRPVSGHRRIAEADLVSYLRRIGLSWEEFEERLRHVRGAK